MQPMDSFKVPLEGTRLVEASAGTGKTFTLETLYLRLLLERRLRVDEILVVTFTRAAAAELRQRIRDRLRGAVEVFEDHRAARPSKRARGSVLERLAESSLARGSLDADHAHLLEGLRSFDEAKISTIHGFCDGVLEENAFESGAAFGTELVSDASLLVDEIVADYWTRELFAAPEHFLTWLEPQGGRTAKALSKLASAVLSPPGTPVRPGQVTPVDRAMEALAPDWKAAFDAALAAWRAQGDEAIGVLLEAAERNILKKNMYGEKYEAGWRADTQAALARPIPGLVSGDKSSSLIRFRKLSTQGIQKAVRKGEAAPEHPLFEVFQRFFAVDAEYVELLETRWLNLEIELVSFVREQVVRRQLERRTRTFDALLTDFAAALGGPSGDALAANVLARHPVALIDEFQDTDPVQYEIFERIWGGPEASLFMIGDPKQAIYAFRGADIFAYMDARRSAEDRVDTLTMNWRSDPDLIRAVNCLFEQSPSPFLFDEIPFYPALAAEGATERMRAEDGAALRFLLLGRAEGEKVLKVDPGKKSIGRAIAADIAGLLASQAPIQTGADGADPASRPLGAGDIAILCRTKKTGRAIGAALHHRGIPNVLRVDDSVFDTPEAADFQALLAAAADPSDGRALRGALSTPLVGLAAEPLAGLIEDPEAWEVWLGRARAWERCWQRGGAIALLQMVFDDHATQGRLLAAPGGERRLTNFLQLAELIQQTAQQRSLGPRALHAWLRRMRIDARARDEGAVEDALIRLESDADTVQILTIHGSKGLQYPVVYCPDLWDGKLLGKDDSARPRFHDPEEDHRLTLDLGTPDQPRAVNRMRWETLAENRRLLYVALTRAKHRLVVAWGAFPSAGASALGLLLHPPPESETLSPEASDELEKAANKRLKSLDDDEIREDLLALGSAAEGAIAVETLVDTEGPELPSQEGVGESLAARQAQRVLATRWRVSSFSGLVAAGGGAHGGSRADTHPSSQGLDYDDAVSGLGESAIASAEGEEKVLLHAFPAGAGPGTMIHEVFEHIDFALPEAGRLDEEIRQALGRHGLAA
ncbi:MAG: UvrD-helicase domain-containing protein, partial [Myxococcota bacterium]|nr:UvrD-helicase domain-containing protein [Myxococcota bacterium]